MLKFNYLYYKNIIYKNKNKNKKMIKKVMNIAILLILIALNPSQ